MHITRKLRPSGLKRGLSTKTFYRNVGVKDENHDIRDVVGTLILSATRPTELSFLADLGAFFCSDKKMALVITDADGKEVASMRRDG